jgi:uncharacterized membrane protein YjjP (DUF1212 family)
MHADTSNEETPFGSACRFLIKLGEAAHGYGSTAARLEAFLSRATAALGYRGAFRSTPSDIVFAFQEDEDQPQRIHLATMPGTGLELNRLAAIGELVDSVEAAEISISDASVRLNEINKMPHPWGIIANTVSYASIGSGIAVLLSGTWWDVLFGGLFSLVVYGMVLMSGRFGTRTAEWLPLSTAFVAGLLAALTQLLLPELNVLLVTLAAILVLIPGFSISVGVVELVSNHVVSGAANLMNGLVYLSKQFAGAWLGVGLAGLFLSTSSVAGTAVDSQWLWLFMPLLIAGLCVVFQTPKRDFFWAAFGCAIAYVGILLGGAIAGSNLGNLLGTVIAVAFANIWARQTKRPTSIVLLPAIVLLVSGSVGFRGLASLAVGETAVGEQQLVQMFVVALTIAAGLLVGNTIVRPKADL